MNPAHGQAGAAAGRVRPRRARRPQEVALRRHLDLPALPNTGGLCIADLRCFLATRARNFHDHFEATSHNVGLKAYLAAKGEDYFRRNMRFALLEFWSMRTEDQHVIDRETYWKEVLLSRSLGHNKN